MTPLIAAEAAVSAEPAAKPKRPLSEAELAARRANAQKGTGPKTEAGKRRSRQNGLKHGLRAEVCLVAEDEAELERRLAGWEHDLNPAGPAERWHVRRAALATVKLDRIEREEAAALAERRRNAVRDWDRARAAEVAGHAARLEADPAGAVAALLESAAGCDWLMEQWRAIAAALALGGGLAPAEIARVDALAGGGPADDPSESPLLLGLALRDRAGLEADLRELALHRRAPALAAPESARRLAALLPTPESARAALEGRIAAELADLDALRADLWAQFDGPARAAAPDRAYTDPSPEGKLLRRYEVATECLLNRLLDRIERNRKSGDLWRGLDPPDAPEALPAPEPEPTADPEPQPAPHRPAPIAPTEPSTQTRGVPSRRPTAIAPTEPSGLAAHDPLPPARSIPDRAFLMIPKLNGSPG